MNPEFIITTSNFSLSGKLSINSLILFSAKYLLLVWADTELSSLM